MNICSVKTSVVSVIFLILLLNAWPTLGQQASETRILPADQELEIPLKGGETHSYKVTLKAGEYFHAEVDQHAIDIILRMVGPNGDALIERDRPNGTSGQEALSFLTTKSGDYRLEVKSPDETVRPGKYTLKNETPRAPTARDKKRVTAENLLQEGIELAKTKTIASLAQAHGKAESAAALWRIVEDKYAEALTYTVLGFVEEALERRHEAVAIYKKSLSLYREVGDQPSVASALSRLSILNALQLEVDVAIAQYREAITIYRDLKDADGEKDLRTELNTIAEAYLQNGREFFQQGGAKSYKNALKVFEIARELYRVLEDTEDEAYTLVALGRINDDLGEKTKALDYYNQALPLHRKLGDESGIATILNNMGSVFSDIGEKRKALEHYEQALPLWNEENKSNLAATLVNIGTVYDDLGERRKALDYYEKRALPLYVEAVNKSGIAATLDSIGSVYSALGKRRKALEYYEEKALPIWIELRDESGIATTYTNIGSVYAAIGEKRKALDYYEKKALPLWTKVGRKADIATTYNNIAGVYSALGEKQKALEYYEEKALPLYTEVGNKPGIATTYTNIGSVYSALGERRKALDYFENKALPIWKAFGRKSGIAATYNNIGRVYDDLGERQKALDFYENKALPLYRESEEKAGIATTLSNIGGVYYDLGEKQKALDYENQALSLHRESEDKAGIATTLSNIGRLYSALGEKRKALDYYENQALPLWIELENKSGEAVVLNNIMVVWDDLKIPRFATLYGKRAVNALQQLRSKNQTLNQEFQKTFLKSVESSYRYLAKLLIEQGRLVEAHQVLNTFKDQQQFDFNHEITKDPPLLAFTKREADFDSNYATASNRIGGIARQIDELKLKTVVRDLGAEESAKLRQLESDLKMATDTSLSIVKQAESEFSQPPDVIKDKTPDIKDTGKLQEALSTLGKTTVAVYTLVGENDFYALIVTFDDIMAVSSPMKGNKLNYKAKQLWALLQSDKYDPTPLSKEVFDVVFKPIKDKLIEKKKLEEVLPEGATIMWSLDGNLRYLPMAALHDGEKYLVERYNNVVFTRADSERWTRAVSSRWTGVGFGNSQGGTIEHLHLFYTFNDLPNVIQELNAVFKTNNSESGIFIGNVFPNRKFKRDAMIAALRQPSPLVHIASHFRFSPGDEERSFLLLGDGAVFPLNEMRKYTDLFHAVELLTLSACETAAQWSDADGREVDGFAELAQRQGAAAVLATLWKVRDDSSYWLLRDFYQRKLNAGSQPKSESLRQAQMALLKGAARVTPLTRTGNSIARKRVDSSTLVKIWPEGSELPLSKEDGVVYVEAKYAQPYDRSAASRYAHPYFWSPFLLFGNWR